VGLALATFARPRTVLVAKDTRVSGPMLESALVSGLESGGANVKLLGVTATPVLAFLTKKIRADVGVMITASHNPPEFNGIKIFSRNGIAYDEEKENKIERIIEQERFNHADWRKVGQDVFADDTRLYVEFMRETMKLRAKRWRVVLDPGCGATFSMAPAVLQAIGCKVEALNAQPDGSFPARSPEPNAESLVNLGAVVKILGADAGLAYDGDGDRAAFVDEKGCFVDFDQVLAAYSGYVVKENRGGTVVTSVEASMAVERVVEQCGGKVMRTKVGDVFIAEMMKKHHAIFGGEPCGAWIHPRLNFCPDGILSSALLLEALENENESLSQFVAHAPKYPVLRRNFHCNNDVKEQVVATIGEKLKARFSEYREFSKIDGVRLALENGWLLVRASGTEPTIRLTVEGESLKAAEQLMEKGANCAEMELGKRIR